MLFFVLSKEIRELKRGLQGDSWEFVLRKRTGSYVDFFTGGRGQKDIRFFLLDDMSRLYRSMKQ